MPTIGRTTLVRAMESVMPQLEPEDELLVVGDGATPAARIMTSQVSGRFPENVLLYLELPDCASDRGATPRDFAIKRARGDYLFFVDDDDICLPEAVKSIRKVLDDRPTLHMFGWMGNPTFLGGMTSGQQLVVPRNKCPLWSDFVTYTQNDRAFYQHALERWPEKQHKIMIADSPDHPGDGKMF